MCWVFLPLKGMSHCKSAILSDHLNATVKHHYHDESGFFQDDSVTLTQIRKVSGTVLKI